ncbi:L-asparaginase / beta-aspartyl-peptidase [Nematocida minor]|uniref:L-asparaginase / beta-aspartyl-peptidase n=1 Tax=Nematocida minor TaxID=1912983 RepID=UPI002220743B|nr:L-asparaginase / beta-aspartyl-peptidase [Nematocida minor]KAI5190846.1 L-asparaginase / beta-aspartyl-peptidase [Nematocida minor]
MKNSLLGFLVHGGAGSCSAAQIKRMKYALRKILAESSSLDEHALSLERSPLFNCGVGSNRTVANSVENECCLMDSAGAFASVCMIPENISPYKALSKYVQVERDPGLVKPISVVYSQGLCSERIREDENKITEHEAGDTVGIAEIKSSTITAVSSSGGPKKKYPGRIGPCSVYGANTFVSRDACVLISGTGESLMRSHLAQRIHRKIESMHFEEVRAEIEEFMKEEKSFPYIGGVGVCRKTANTLFIVHFQSAASFVYGYNFGGLLKVISHIQPEGCVTVNVERVDVE